MDLIYLMKGLKNFKWNRWDVSKKLLKNKIIFTTLEEDIDLDIFIVTVLTLLILLIIRQTIRNASKLAGNTFYLQAK